MAYIYTITPEVNLYGRQIGIETKPFNTFKLSKDYMRNIRNYILNVIKEDYEERYTNIHKLEIKKAYGKLQVKYGGWSEKEINYIIEKELMNHFVERFESEFNHDYNKKIYPRIHRRIENYLLGLAYNFSHTYHDQTKQAIEFHDIKFEHGLPYNFL